MKLNMGCGYSKMPGYVNVDHYIGCSPDQVCDLEQMPWPWPDSSVEAVTFNHSLEHLGQNSSIFLQMMQELYRICVDGALITINVPHPRHDNFLNDPTHVRPITAPLLALFDRQENERIIDLGGSNTPLAVQLKVDFHIEDMEYTIDDRYKTAFENGKFSREELEAAMLRENNVVSEIRMVLSVRKDAAAAARAKAQQEPVRKGWFSGAKQKV